MYIDLAAALARAKERSGATTANDAYLTELLTMSAGKVEGVTHYRPFYVAARFLEQNRSLQALDEAKGVKFSGQRLPIASLFSLQANYDAGFGLTVPAGFEAIGSSSSSSQTIQRFGTQTRAKRTTP